MATLRKYFFFDSTARELETLPRYRLLERGIERLKKYLKKLLRYLRDRESLKSFWGEQ